MPMQAFACRAFLQGGASQARARLDPLGSASPIERSPGTGFRFGVSNTARESVRDDPTGYLTEKVLRTVTDPPKYGVTRADWNVRITQPALTPSPLSSATETFCTSPDEA